jgi:hypothetical protein
LLEETIRPGEPGDVERLWELVRDGSHPRRLLIARLLPATDSLLPHL